MGKIKQAASSIKRPSLSILKSTTLNIRSFIKHHLPAQPCSLCGAASDHGTWCATCDADLPRLGSAHCPVCALPSFDGKTCGRCLQHSPAFDHTIAAFAYAFPVDKLIQAVKFSERLTLVAQLADALPHRIDTLPDAIIPMPLHPLRLRERGFNQSLLLAQHLAKRLNIPLLTDACERARNTSPQSSLKWQEREKNMHKAFVCTADLSGKHIAIVDDVMTTGASIEELARTLRQAGTTQVSAWVLARTLPH
jgi:ComF family protein